MEGGIRGIVIVFSAFMIQFLAFGNYACIGIYTVHLLHDFDNNAVSVSLVSAIHSALLLCSGPLASFLMTKISFRKLSLAGAALVVIGIFCTPLLVYLPTMYIFFGVFAGLGGCLIYLPSHVLSGLYYEKYRTISTGVATAGTGMGATVMPLIVGMLIEEYTWKGSMIILAGLDMHLFIFAMLMRQPPKPKTKKKISSSTSTRKVSDRHCDVGKDCLLTDSPDLRANRTIGSVQYTKVEPQFQNKDRGKNNQLHQIENNLHDNHQHLADHDLPTISESDEDLDQNKYVRKREHKGRRGTNSSSHLRIIILNSLPEDDISNVFIPSYLTWVPNFRNSFSVRRPSAVLETEILDSEDDLDAELGVEHNSSECNDVEVVSLVSEARASFTHISMKEHFKHHLRVVTDFKFVIYFVSTIIWSMTTTLFVTFGPDFIVMKGHAAVDVAFVFTFYGAGQLLGCIFISIVGNFLGSRIILYMVANVLTGVFMGVVPLFDSFTSLAIVLVCMGFALGGILGLYMIVSVDILGVKDMEIGLGYVLLASGVGCFAGPPLGGYLSQIYGGYVESFYMAAVLTVFGGLVMAVLYIPKCCSKNKTQTPMTTDK